MSITTLETLRKIKYKQLQNNQLVVSYPNGDEAFYSYGRLIALKESEPRYMDTFGDSPICRTYLNVNAWDYSRTTGKYRNIFLNETKRETEKKIKSGAYILKDLD